MAPVHVVAVCGSLAADSATRKAARIALATAGERDASTELVDLRELTLPVFDADAADAGDAPELRSRVDRADSILLGTPMYHGSYASPLKTALDYCGFEEFSKKTVGLLGVSGGRFPITALEHLRSVCRALDCWVIPHQAAIPQADSLFEGDRLVEDDVRARVETLGRELVRFADIEADPATIESGENVGADRRP